MADDGNGKKDRRGGKDHVSPHSLLLGAHRHLRGIESDIDSITLLDRPWRGNVTQAVQEATLTRTLEGASTLTITVDDSDRELLNSRLLENRYKIRLDGLEFGLAAISKSGRNLELVHEDWEVVRMKRHGKGHPKKAFRDQVTRAEFVYSLVHEIKHPKIPFYSPEIHTEQPIADAPADRRAEESVSTDAGNQTGKKGGGGLAGAHGLTVKGVAANAEQIRNGETVMRVGVEDGADARVLASAIVSGIQENNMTNADAGSGCRGYFCIIDSTAAALSFNPLDLAAAAHSYYTNGFGGPPGAVDYARQNPGASPAVISSAIEGNAAGASDRIRWEGEAKKWVEAFTGGAALEPGGGDTTVTKTQVERYSFERKKDESTWACAVRLAEEVRWRAFVSAGIFYFVAETDLLSGKVRMEVSEDKPGIDEIDFDFDPGRKVNEMEITGRARSWAAPPGTVALVRGYGPANGRYIVSSIDSNLFSEDVSVTLKRPAEPMPEPAPEVTQTTKTVPGGGGDAEAGDPSQEEGVGNYDGKPVAKWIIPYLEKSREHGWGGSVTSGYRTPEYSESLCFDMCGAPSCPGTCAGRSSNHSGSKYPAGAVDVSDPGTFGSIQPKIGSPLKNDLPADPVHFSVSGH